MSGIHAYFKSKIHYAIMIRANKLGLSETEYIKYLVLNDLRTNSTYVEDE